MSDDLEIVDGAEAGAWIAPRLEGGFGGKVEQLVPNGYDGYVRVLHPAHDQKGDAITRACVAETFAKAAHPEMQWDKLTDASEAGANYRGRWQGEKPPTGELDQSTLLALLAVIAAHSEDNHHCFFGLSTIYGVEQFYSSAVQLRWPARDFVVFAGPLEAADQVGYESESYGAVRLVDGRWQQVPPTPRWFSQPPNLIWPADHAWFVQSEYDLDSTLVGGSRSLVDALLGAPDLETWEVERGNSLEAWADKIN